MVTDLKTLIPFKNFTAINLNLSHYHPNAFKRLVSF